MSRSERHEDVPDEPADSASHGEHPPGELSDRECVILARAGRSKGLAVLVRRYSTSVYNLMARVLRDRDLAEDAVQEVFLRVHRSLDRFDVGRSFRSWLYAIAWNFARDLLRRRQTRSVEKRFANWGNDDGESPENQLADPHARRPDESVERIERATLVREALDRLEPEQRALLLLRDFEGLAYEEIGTIMKCRIGTVKSRINRARLKLKDVLLRLNPEFAEAENGG
jgi:RNA polymerase sigma-70 factor (ECF subfamily)